jgi:hypothetical protein
MTRSRNKITLLEYYAYRLSIKRDLSIIHLAGDLFQQYVVDAYVKIEGNNLNYLRHNQTKLRICHYQGLMDHLTRRQQDENLTLGSRFILPSSHMVVILKRFNFVLKNILLTYCKNNNIKGSPRFMRQNYQDAMTIVRNFGKPDLFITFTANPQWKEIQENLNGMNYMDRPDLCVRVFWLKFDQFCHEIFVNHVLGRLFIYIKYILFILLSYLNYF